MPLCVDVLHPSPYAPLPSMTRAFSADLFVIFGFAFVLRVSERCGVGQPRGNDQAQEGAEVERG